MNKALLLNISVYKLHTIGERHVWDNWCLASLFTHYFVWNAMSLIDKPHWAASVTHQVHFLSFRDGWLTIDVSSPWLHLCSVERHLPGFLFDIHSEDGGRKRPVSSGSFAAQQHELHSSVVLVHCGQQWIEHCFVLRQISRAWSCGERHLLLT